MDSLETSLEYLKGMQLIGDPGSHEVTFEASVQIEDLIKLVELLHVHKKGLNFLDLRYPSPSDPGAYLNYSSKGAPADSWKMTFGNHGWTGGTYLIDNSTIALQIFNLAQQNHLQKIQIERDQPVSRNPLKSEAENREMVERLRRLHLA